MKRAPKLSRHQKRNYAYITVNRKQIYLGVWGSEESYQNYLNFLRKGGYGEQDFKEKLGGISLVGLVREYIKDYQTRSKKNKSDLNTFKRIEKRILKCMPEKKAEDFRIKDLETIRDSFQNEGFKRNQEQCEYSRGYLNKIVIRIKTMINWGAGKELISHEVSDRLKYLIPLKKGRTKAKEPKRKRIVPEYEFKETCKYLSEYYKDIVEIIRYTGMRPSELCNMKVKDIKTSAEVWLYCPGEHKTEESGKERFIGFGKEAKCILKKHLKNRNPEEYVFTPKRAMVRKWEKDRKERKSKIQPSQIERSLNRKNKRLKAFNDKLNVDSIGRRVKEACKKAMREGVIKEMWTPYELRHTAISEVRVKFGAEAAQHFAGHSQLNTQRYYDHTAERIVEEIASRIG